MARFNEERLSALRSLRAIFLVPDSGSPVHDTMAHIAALGQGDRLWFERCEVVGGKVLALLKAWNTGHPGGLTTVHANSAAAALMRLDTLIQEAGVPPQPRLVAEAIDLVVFIARTADGRRVRELAAVTGYEPGTGSYALTPTTSAA